MSPDKLVYMVNQIGKYFVAQNQEKAAGAIADHLQQFWDPRMRRGIIAHLAETGGTGLEPASLSAVQILAAGKQTAA